MLKRESRWFYASRLAETKKSKRTEALKDYQRLYVYKSLFKEVQTVH